MVIRFSGIFEPRRAPALTILNPLPGQTGSGAYERREQAGLGIDFAFSKDLKVYSLAVYNHHDNFQSDSPFSAPLKSDDYMGILRLTNESFPRVTLSIDAIFTYPNPSYLISPEIGYRLGTSWQVALGARVIGSSSPSSVFESLKSVSQVYSYLTYQWTVRPTLKKNK